MKKVVEKGVRKEGGRDKRRYKRKQGRKERGIKGKMMIE